MWQGLFPAEQARIMHLIVDSVEIGPSGADMRLKLEGLGNLASDRAEPSEVAHPSGDAPRSQASRFRPNQAVRHSAPT
jgi:hypothetical protein